VKHPTLATLLALSLGAAIPAAAAPADDLRADIQDRVNTFLQTETTARAHWRADLVAPSMILGLYAAAEGETAQAKAESWVAEHAALFGLRADELVLAGTSSFRGRTTVTFQQVHGQLPVHQRTMVVVVDEQGLIQRVVNGTLPVIGLKRAADVDAHAIAAARFDPRARVSPQAAHKRVVMATPAGAYEAAIVQVAPSPERLQVLEVVVDLNAGEITSLRPTIKR
jgi:Zn-dependent metalloprotease